MFSKFQCARKTEIGGSMLIRSPNLWRLTTQSILSTRGAVLADQERVYIWMGYRLDTDNLEQDWTNNDFLCERVVAALPGQFRMSCSK